MPKSHIKPDQKLHQKNRPFDVCPHSVTADLPVDLLVDAVALAFLGCNYIFAHDFVAN